MYASVIQIKYVWAQCARMLWKYFCLLHNCAHTWMHVWRCVCVRVRIFTWMWMWFDSIWFERTYVCGIGTVNLHLVGRSVGNIGYAFNGLIINVSSLNHTQNDSLRFYFIFSCRDVHTKRWMKKKRREEKNEEENNIILAIKLSTHTFPCASMCDCVRFVCTFSFDSYSLHRYMHNNRLSAQRKRLENFALLFYC